MVEMESLFQMDLRLLKIEMKALGSLVLKVGEETAVPAGDALAVDRELFSSKIDQILKEHPLIEMWACDVEDPEKKALEYGCSHIIVATGPLTTTNMEKWITFFRDKDYIHIN